MAKFFRFPWATAGDKTAIPDATDVTGLVSYQQGYGADYQRDPATDPLAKRIERNKLNQVLADITDNVRLHQTNTFPAFITSADNGGVAFAYDVDAIVRYDDGGGYNLYQNTTAANTNIPTGAGWVLKEGIAGLNSPALTGTPTIGGINLSPYYGKNYIINGNFDIWNYGTSGTTSVGVATYTANRWIITSTGVGAPWSKQATDKSGQYGLQVAGTAGLTGVRFTQRIESIMGRRASGKAITIQYKIYSPDSRTITYSSKTADVIDIFSAITQKHTGTFNVVTGWNTGSFTISALDATSYRGFDVELQCGALTSGNLAIAQMQAEEGSVATSWSPYFGEFGGEVQACARYYELGNNSQYNPITAVVGLYSQYKSLKRIAPSVTVTAGTTQNIYVDGHESYTNTTAGIWYLHSWTASAEL